MTDKKDIPANDTNRPPESAVPKRPHATLDLKAVEVREQAAARSEPMRAEAAVKIETPAASKPSDPSAATKTSPALDAGAKPGDTKSVESPRAAAPKPAEPARPMPPPKIPSTLGHLSSHLMAGIAGGLLALLSGDWLAQKTGFVVGNASLHDSSAALQRRVTALEQAASEAGDDDVAAKFAATEDKLVKLEALSAEIAYLRDAQTGLASESKSLSSKIELQAADTKAADRITKLEGQLATLVTAAGPDGTNGGPIPQLASITGKIADLESNLSTQIAALRQTLPQDLESRIGTIGEASETAKAGTARIDRDITAIKTDTARFGQRIEALKADGDRLSQSLQAIQEETGKLSSTVGEVRGTIETQAKSFLKPADIASSVAPVTGKLAKLEENLQDILKSEAERNSNAERIVTSLELANLKRVIDRGQSYTTELDAVRSVSGGRIDLAALDRHKDGGVPSLADLQRDSRRAINAMIDAGTNLKEGSLLDQFVAGARSVVRVRKSEFAPGDTSADAIAARMEAALVSARLGDVLTEANKLSPGAQAAAKDWIGQVEARASIDAAMAAIEKQLKSSLTGSAGSGPASKDPGSTEDPK